MRGGLILSAGINGFLAVAAGAFAAHGLKATASPGALSAFETGAHYHFVHAVLFMAMGLIPRDTTVDRLTGLSALFIWAGIILFSGSLYFLGLTESRSLVLVTPVGGVGFLIGWLCLALFGWKVWRGAANGTTPPQ